MSRSVFYCPPKGAVFRGKLRQIQTQIRRAERQKRAADDKMQQPRRPVRKFRAIYARQFGVNAEKIGERRACHLM